MNTVAEQNPKTVESLEEILKYREVAHDTASHIDAFASGRVPFDSEMLGAMLANAVRVMRGQSELLSILAENLLKVDDVVEELSARIDG